MLWVVGTFWPLADFAPDKDDLTWPAVAAAGSRSVAALPGSGLGWRRCRPHSSPCPQWTSCTARSPR